MILSLEAKQEIAERLLGTITWEGDAGTATCPGAASHTNPGETCTVFLDYNAPTIHCMHASCAGEIQGANFWLRSEIGKAEHPRTLTRDEQEVINQKARAVEVLKKVRAAFKVSNPPSETCPKEVTDYLLSRKIASKTTARLFSYIPDGGLSKVLTPEEIELVHLGSHQGKLILWYLKDGQPVYFVSRAINEKAFKKAYRQDEILDHPIWNIDHLFTESHVVWGEGMFDCTSLIELGYGCCGEITCHPIGEHLEPLRKILWWRKKHHPDWKFTICLDNDQPAPKTGTRAGNEAAEKLALHLWSHGLDVHWVKHDPAAAKVDINLLHQQNKGDQIENMIDSAKLVSEIVDLDHELALRNILRCLSQHDSSTAFRLIKRIENSESVKAQVAVIKTAFKLRVPYQEIYHDELQLFRYGDDVYAVHPMDYYGHGKKNYDVFTKTAVVDNLRGFQKNPDIGWGFNSIDIPIKRPDWRVTTAKNQKDSPQFNLFQPSPYLLQRPRTGAELPPLFNRVLNNLSGSVEKEWLLNHMATWVQTFQKPITLPVFVGPQGTGKTSLMQFLGEGIGGFINVGMHLFEGDFNEWMTTAVILLDELATTEREAKAMKSKTKSLVNTAQTINTKFEKLMTIQHNSYIAISSNEQVTGVPVIVEPGDRRFTFIAGGRNNNLLKDCKDWFDYDKWHAEIPAFMLYLLSRPIDEAAARIPIENEMKQDIAHLGEEAVVAAVREWVEQHKLTDVNSASPLAPPSRAICAAIKNEGLTNYLLSPKRLVAILKSMAFIPVVRHNQIFWPQLSLDPVSIDTPKELVLDQEFDRLAATVPTEAVAMLREQRYAEQLKEWPQDWVPFRAGTDLARLRWIQATGEKTCERYDYAKRQWGEAAELLKEVAWLTQNGELQAPELVA